MDWALLSLLPIGIITALSPCPLATNIAAVAFIAQQPGFRRQSAMAALCYTLGRMGAYVLIGLLVSEGLSSAPSLSFWVQEKLPVFLGPVMMVAGLVILGFVPFFSLGEKTGRRDSPSPGGTRRSGRSLCPGLSVCAGLMSSFCGLVFWNSPSALHAGGQ